MAQPSSSTSASGKAGLSGHDSDVQDWQQIKAGDRSAFGRLYNRHFKSLYNYGIRFSKDAGVVEDGIQELFIELWRKQTQLSEVTRVKHYLYKSLRRKILYKLSMRREITNAPHEAFEIELAAHTHFLHEQLDPETCQKVKMIIGSLTPKQKEAIFLIYYDELSYEETASVMGLKVKSVYNLVHLGISQLRKEKHSLGRLLFCFSLL